MAAYGALATPRGTDPLRGGDEGKGNCVTQLSRFTQDRYRPNWAPAAPPDA